MKKCLVGIVSWCDSNRFPQRFKVFKKVVASIEKYVPKDSCEIVVVDNNSSEDVKTFIETSTVFNQKILLPENIHDVGAYSILAQMAQDLGIPYVWVLENDYVLFKKVPIDDIISFLEEHPECGYMRLQKFEVKKQYKYDKTKKQSSNVDTENAVWLKNIETEKALEWSDPVKINGNDYYTTNWHFGMHGGMISLKIWEKIFPNKLEKVPYYYKLESEMRKEYSSLGLDVAVLDRGVFSMAAPSVYQPPQKKDPFTLLLEQLQGPKGGFIEKSILSHYQKNYLNYLPTQIQLFGNSLGSDELKALGEVFDSHWLGYGPKSKQFEYEFGNMLGAKYCLGISSCTAGLFMSMEMIGVKKGDEVIIPTVGFIGCANAVIKAGATPVFADVDPQYFNLLPSELDRLITPKTKAVILLHYAGVPAQMKEIRTILDKQDHKIYLIEDSANSFKSRYFDTYCGTIGDIGLFSLDANKTITTGTGGILTTNDDDLYYKAQVMRFYGLKPSSSSGYDALRARKERWWEIELEHHGNRYLINDITSAIGLTQLKKLDKFILERKKMWEFYNKKLQKIHGISLPQKPPQDTTSSYYFHWIQVEDADKQLSLAKRLVSNGIYTSFRYYPLHLIEYYKQFAKTAEKLPNAEKIAQTSLNLPLHQNLKQSHLDRIVDTISSWARK